jgi:hypothetical protein
MNLLSKTGGRRTISSESLIAGETAIAAIAPGAYRNGVDGDGSIFATLLAAAAGDGDLLLSRVSRRLKRDSLLVEPEPEPLPLLLASESSEGLDREPATVAAILAMALAVLCWSCCIIE